MKHKLVGIFVCMLLIITVLPVSGTVKVEKNIMPTENDGTLSGYVTDSAINPIEGALVRVYFHGTYEEDYTDSNGYYHVTNIPICYCMKNCTASKSGYKSEWVLLAIVEDTTYDFMLASAEPGAKLEIDISDYLGGKNPIIRYSHGVQIENVGDETANGISVDFWVYGGIFSKLRERLNMTDYWAYGGNKIEPGEKTYCPVHLNILYLGSIEMTAKVWADNAEPVTKTINAFASFGFIWINTEN